MQSFKDPAELCENVVFVEIVRVVLKLFLELRTSRHNAPYVTVTVGNLNCLGSA